MDRNELLDDIQGAMIAAHAHAYGLKKGWQKNAIDIAQDWEIVLGCLEDAIKSVEIFSEMMNSKVGEVQ